MIGMMRVLCAENKQLLIFDEPTNNLDEINRSAFLEIINERALSITILLIIHSKELNNNYSLGGAHGN